MPEFPDPLELPLAAAPPRAQLNEVVPRLRLTASGAKVIDASVSQPWGLREFHVEDPEGNQITFGQPFEGAPSETLC
jgi:hypothetical protein